MSKQNPESAFDLVQLVSDAQSAAEEAWDRITQILRSQNPFELIPRLTLTLFTVEGHEIDPEDAAYWQVRIELVSWYYLANPASITIGSDPIDYSIVEKLITELDSYFNSYSLSLIAFQQELPNRDQQIRFKLRTERLYVRGEASHSDIKALVNQMYSKHGTWWQSHIGISVESAICIADGLFSLSEHKLSSCRDEAITESELLRPGLDHLLLIPEDDVAADDKALRQYLEEHGVDQVIRNCSFNSLLAKMSSLLTHSFSELSNHLSSNIDEQSLERFLNYFSTSLASSSSAIDPIGFNPLTECPILKFDTGYFVPVPSLLYEAILFKPHFELIRDAAYRAEYDIERSSWLENHACTILKRVFGESSVYQNLSYGPKGNRAEVDGLILWGRKLIAIECKWKSITLQAMMGDVDTFHKDASDSIGEALRQGSRVLSFVASSPTPVTFVDSAGHQVEIDPKMLDEFIVVAVFGRGLMSMIGANLPMFVESHDVSDAHAWCGSVLDLEYVCELLETPSLLLDFLRKREAFVSDPRYFAHDESDLLGMYCSDNLRVPFKDTEDVSSIFCSGYGDEIENWRRSRSASGTAVGVNPGRSIPSVLRGWIATWDREVDVLGVNAGAKLLELNDVDLQRIQDNVFGLFGCYNRDSLPHHAYLKFASLDVCLLLCDENSRQEVGKVRDYAARKKMEVNSDSVVLIAFNPTDLEIPVKVVCL